MRIFRPAYYDRFHCIAGACPDSCCKEWTVVVDPEAAAKYRALPGPLGDRLRAAMDTDEAGDTELVLEDGRCPMWRSDGLCQIQVQIGEEALCQVCRRFPRLTHDYGDFVELGLELSCPEAARLIFASPAAPFLWEDVPGGTEPAYDRQAMTILRQTRQTLLAFLEDRTYSIGQVLTVLLLYCYDVDDALSFSEDAPEEFLPEDYLRLAEQLPRQGALADIFEFYRSLEILTPRWRRILENGPVDSPWSEDFRPLIRYFLERYCLQAVSDYDLAARAKFMALSCLMIRAAGGSTMDAAQLYSKEIENDADNVNAILDAAFADPALNDSAIVTLLLA